MKAKLIILFLIQLSISNISIGQHVMPTLGPHLAHFTIFTVAGAITNAGDSSVVSGNVGSQAGAIDQSIKDNIINGETHIGDTTTQKASGELNSIYAEFDAKKNNSKVLPAAPADSTFERGFYVLDAAVSMSGVITLDAKGDPDAVFLFKIGGAFAFQPNASIVLINQANLNNVYFQADGAISIYADSKFQGILVSNGAISLSIGSSVNGKIYSVAGAITLNNNYIVSIFDALPITLSGFIANKNQNNTVDLSWSTAKEFNSDRFEIEKSLSGKEWQTIGTVEAAGESRQMKHYFFSTEYVEQGSNFYRLKMIDQDNTFKYSRIRTVSFPVEDRSVLYPNPAIDELTLDLEDMAMVDQILVRDISGRTVYDQRKTGSSNLTNSIDVKNLSAGTYGVQITRANGKIIFSKILKQ